MEAAVRGGLNPGSQLKPWQMRGLARFSTERQAGHGIIIADKMGYGKTISAIVCACEARAGSGRRPVVFVVPTAVESNWRAEIGRFTNWARVYMWRECSEAQRALLFAPGTEVDAVIMSHTALSSVFMTSYKKVEVQKFHKKDADFFRRFHPTDAEHPLFTARHLAAAVIDESHILRNPDTLLYASAMFAGRGAAAWLCLTGTPHQNKIEDCVSQLELCHARPQFTESGALRRCKAALLEQLHQTSLIRATEPLDLPPLARVPIRLEMPEEEGAVMDALLNRVIEVLEAFVAANVGFDHVLVEFLRIRKVSVCLPLLEEAEVAELERVRDESLESRGRPPKEEKNHAKRALAIMANPSAKILKCMERIRAHFTDGRKTVVFCSFVDPLFAMAEMLNDEKDGTAAVYYGGLTHPQKETVLGQFNSNPDCRVMFVSLRSGGTGLNLQVASAAIHLDKWWNPAISDQATGRIWRMGQPRDCVVEYIEYENSFDDACADLYHSYKQRNADTFLAGKYDGKKDETIKFDSSAAASLLEEIATRRGLESVAQRARKVRTALQPERQMKNKGISNRVVAEMRHLRQEQAAAELEKRVRVEPPKPTPSLAVHLPSFKPKTSPLAGLRAQFRAEGPRMQYMVAEAQRQRVQSSIHAAKQQCVKLEEFQM
jgi:SNF2 family DNA or RNA helicase